MSLSRSYPGQQVTSGGEGIAFVDEDGETCGFPPQWGEDSCVTYVHEDMIDYSGVLRVATEEDNPDVGFSETDGIAAENLTFGTSCWGRHSPTCPDRSPGLLSRVPEVIPVPPG